MSHFQFSHHGQKNARLTLTTVESAFLAANAFVSCVNSDGLEGYIESPEADHWPELRKVIEFSTPACLGHFDRLISITGEKLSPDRQQRVAQWQAIADSSASEIQELESQYYQQVYPTPADITNYLDNEDVVLITNEQLEAASDIASSNSPRSRG